MASRRTTTTTRESRVRSRQGEADQTTTTQTQTTTTSGGMGFTDALILGTTVLLIAAFVMMDKVLGAHFNTGMFFTS